MDDLLIALLASGAMSALLLIVVWRRSDPVKSKLAFSALLLIPVFGPLGYIIILGISDAPPQDKRLQNLGGYGNYTQSAISMREVDEASLARLEKAAKAGSNELVGVENDNLIDPDFKPAQGWILVTHTSMKAIELAIADYDRLYIPERPGTFKIQLHPQSSGSTALVLPDGLPAYDLPNLTAWLNNLPDQPEVSNAVAWITAPADGARYYLERDPGNSFGDTLIGASSTGQPVRVYLPETGLVQDCTEIAYRDEPDIELATNPTTLAVVLETCTEFGNPEFELSKATL